MQTWVINIIVSRLRVDGRGVYVMTKKEYCLSHDHIAYYSGVGGIEIHGVEGGLYILY